MVAKEFAVERVAQEAQMVPMGLKTRPIPIVVMEWVWVREHFRCTISSFTIASLRVPVAAAFPLQFHIMAEAVVAAEFC